MSCSAILGCLSDKPITSKEIEEMTGIKRTYISGCLHSYVKSGKVIKTEIVRTNEMGHKCVYAYALAKKEETVV